MSTVTYSLSLTALPSAANLSSKSASLLKCEQTSSSSLQHVVWNFLPRSTIMLLDFLSNSSFNFAHTSIMVSRFLISRKSSSGIVTSSRPLAVTSSLTHHWARENLPIWPALKYEIMVALWVRWSPRPLIFKDHSMRSQYAIQFVPLLVNFGRCSHSSPMIVCSKRWVSF